jgi:hypothetical protein
MRIKAPNGVVIDGREIGQDVHLTRIGINTADLQGATDLSVEAIRFVESDGRRMPLGSPVQSILTLGQIPAGEEAEKQAIRTELEQLVARASDQERPIVRAAVDLIYAAGGDAAAASLIGAAFVTTALQAMVTARHINIP